MIHRLLLGLTVLAMLSGCGVAVGTAAVATGTAVKATAGAVDLVL